MLLIGLIFYICISAASADRIHELLNLPADAPTADESWHRTFKQVGQKKGKRFWEIFLAIRSELGDKARQKYVVATSASQNR